MVLRQSLGPVCLYIIITLVETASGVPANREVRTFQQPDGTGFQAALYGDEFYSYYQTPEGEIILQDRDTGTWFYAEPKADGSLEKTSIPVGQGRIGIAAVNSEKPQWLNAVQKIVAQRAASVYAPSVPTKDPSAKGTVRGVLLLANFSDTSTTFTRSVFHELLNTTGYQSNGAAGSVKDYYLEASYGQLSLQIDAYDWVRLPQPQAYYGTDDPKTGGPKDLNIRQMIEETIKAADPNVNFADYDYDSDGWVELLGVMHQGQGEEQTGASADCIYSHRGSLDKAVEVDGVKIQDYYVVPEKLQENLITIGTFCHEIAHRFRLPDLYDLDSSSKGVGDWSLMGSGSWLGPQGRRGAKPCHVDPWCKYMLGWLTPEVLGTSRTGVSLGAFDTNPRALLIPADPYQEESGSGFGYRC